MRAPCKRLSTWRACPWPGCELPQKTPIENLYNVGDGVKVSGWIGLEASAQTGRLVAEDIQARFRRR